MLLFNFIFLLQSCYKRCADNLTIENNKIPYIDSQLIAFQNDTLGVRYDTIFLYLADMSHRHYLDNNSDDVNEECTSWSDIRYSNKLYIAIVQAPNGYGNGAGIAFNSMESYYNSDKQKILYNGDSVNALNIYTHNDSLNSPIWKYICGPDSTYVYNNYYFLIDSVYKLIQYTTVYRDGTRRIWKLKD